MIFGETHVFHTQVEFDDLDAGGVVHHPKYLNLLERARTRGLADASYPFSQCLKDGHCFVISETRAKYLRPLRYEDKITILSRCVALRRSSIKVFQGIFMGHLTNADAQKMGDAFLDARDAAFVAQLRLVFIDLASMAPKELTPDLRRAFRVPTDQSKLHSNTHLKEAWTNEP